MNQGLYKLSYVTPVPKRIPTLRPTKRQSEIKGPHLQTMGHVVAQLVEALSSKPEGRGFDSRWCHWNFSWTQTFQSHYGPGVDSASNRNKYQEYFLGVKADGA